jgi:hypothetical protein
MRSVARCYKQDKSKMYLVMRESPASKDVNTEVESYMVLETVTRRQPVCAVVNCRVFELATAL